MEDEAIFLSSVLLPFLFCFLLPPLKHTHHFSFCWVNSSKTQPHRTQGSDTLVGLCSCTSKTYYTLFYLQISLDQMLTHID